MPALLKRSVALGLLAILLVGCGRDEVTQNTTGPILLTRSQAWLASVSPDEGQARIRELERSLRALRNQTGSGWTGRQDDSTGYLTQLSGGVFDIDGTAEDLGSAFLAGWGIALFGVEGTDIALSKPSPPDATGSVIVEGSQQHNGVPVEDSRLVLTVAFGDTDPRLTAVSGRVFPGIGVSGDPQIKAGKAARLAAEASGGKVQGKPSLVVLAGEAAGALTWRVTVVGVKDTGLGAIGDQAVTIYYVDALDGTIVAVKATSTDAHAPPAGRIISLDADGRAVKPAMKTGLQLPQGSPVSVTGVSPNGKELTANAIQIGNGDVLLIDTTVPSYDAATTFGGISTHDATGLGDSQLPGDVVTVRGARVDDEEAIAAHAMSRYIYDYFLQVHGRNSWDGQGSSLVSSIHYGGDSFCNAFFNGDFNPPQMVYGGGCVQNGKRAYLTDVEIDTAGHEITHGVTDSTAGLAYVGQSGALNESFSDYFGNVVGNLFNNTDNAGIFEDECAMEDPSPNICITNPDGTVSARFMLNGATLKDVLNLMALPLRLSGILNQDNGGVHINSAIWNNALWSIRARLAQIDGKPGNESPRARQFDTVVYAALTRLLFPEAGFLDARAAIEQAARDLQVDGDTARVIKETFDLNQFCQQCILPEAHPAQAVAMTSAAEGFPAVSGDRVAWVEQSLGPLFGTGVVGGFGMEPVALTEEGAVTSVAFSGDSVITTELVDPTHAGLFRYDSAGGQQQIDGLGDQGIVLGVAGSAEGAAWIEGGQLHFIAPDGAVTAAELPHGNEEWISIGTGGGFVAAGSKQGTIVVWEVGSSPIVAAQGGSPVFAVDAFGPRAIATSDCRIENDIPTCNAYLLQGPGDTTVLSEAVAPFGATISAEHAVWTSVPGALGGAVAEAERHAGLVFSDSDLHMFSFATGVTYEIVARRGQQGFPELSGSRLVWQDTALGGDDIFTGLIPAGL